MSPTAAALAVLLHVLAALALWWLPTLTQRQDIEQKLAEMQETIVLKRAGNAQGALAVVLTDRGKLLMDHIREVTDQFHALMRGLLRVLPVGQETTGPAQHARFDRAQQLVQRGLIAGGRAPGQFLDIRTIRHRAEWWHVDPGSHS